MLYASPSSKARRYPRQWRPQTLVLFGGLGLMVTLWFITVSQNLAAPPESPAVRAAREKAAQAAQEAAVQEQSAWIGDSESPPHRLLLCAKVGSETPYLLEWLEFHRLQGVSKFVLYADDMPVASTNRVSTNALYTFKRLYAEKLGLPDLIDVHSSLAVFSEVMDDFLGKTYEKETTQMHRLAQQSVLKHCFSTYSSKTEWLGHIDVDEFLYSPKFASLSDFFASLYDSRPEIPRPPSSLAYAYQYGNLSGVYVWPVNYGLSDTRVLDYRVSIIDDAIRGQAEVVFDPRYKRKEAADPKARNALFDWISTSGQNLNEATDDERRRWFAQLLEKDERRRRRDEQGDFSGLLPHLDELQQKIQVGSAEVGAESGTPAFSASKARTVDEFVWQKTAEMYPLIIEEQTHRMLNLDYGDAYEDVARNVIELFPHCRAYVEKLLQPVNAHLRSRLNTKERIKKLGEPERNECIPGNLPPQITNLGKTLTWTGRRHQPPSGWLASNPQAYHTKAWRRNPHMMHESLRPVHDPRVDDADFRLEECHQPWVHHCAHKTRAPVASADLHSELRLDHHMLRSIERRTVADVSWRNKAGTGRFGEGSGAVQWNLLRMVSHLEDGSKTRFVGQLRQSLARFHLTPMATEVFQRKTGLDYATTWDHSTCSLPKMLTANQFSCPKSDPKVGYLGSRIYPPHGLVPLGWCTSGTLKVDPTLEEKNYEPAAFEDCDITVEDMKIPRCELAHRLMSFDYEKNNTSLCPGFPHAGCCDHNSEMSEVAEKFFRLIGADNRLAKATIELRNLSALFWHQGSHLNYSDL